MPQCQKKEAKLIFLSHVVFQILSKLMVSCSHVCNSQAFTQNHLHVSTLIHFSQTLTLKCNSSGIGWHSRCHRTECATFPIQLPSAQSTLQHLQQRVSKLYNKTAEEAKLNTISCMLLHVRWV